MRNCLYKDYADGLLQLLILAIPLALGLFAELKWKQIQSVPLTLTLAIISLLYAEYNLYKDTQYKYNKRIKTELALSMMALSITLVLTLFRWKTSNDINQYTILVVLYGLSALPFLIETMYAFLINDLEVQLKKKKKRENKARNHFSKFDLRAANIN